MKNVLTFVVVILLAWFGHTALQGMKDQEWRSYQDRMVSSEKHTAEAGLVRQIIDKYTEQVEVIKARTGKDPVEGIGLFPEDRFSPVILRYRLNNIRGETPRDISYDAQTALRILIAFEIFIGPGEGKVDDEVIQAARFRCGSSVQLEKVRERVLVEIDDTIGGFLTELDRVRLWTWDTVPEEYRSQYRKVRDD